jgi:hypothetical protein
LQAFATFMSVLSIDCSHVPSMCSVGEIYKAKGMLQVWRFAPMIHPNDQASPWM